MTCSAPNPAICPMCRLRAITGKTRQTWFFHRRSCTVLTLLIKLASIFNKHFKEGPIQRNKEFRITIGSALFFFFWLFVDEPPLQLRQNGWIWIPSTYLKALSRKLPWPRGSEVSVSLPSQQIVIFFTSPVKWKSKVEVLAVVPTRKKGGPVWLPEPTTGNQDTLSSWFCCVINAPWRCLVFSPVSSASVK